MRLRSCDCTVLTGKPLDQKLYMLPNLIIEKHEALGIVHND